MEADTLAERIIAFNRALQFDGVLPEGVRIMNPFAESPTARIASEAFYRKFYSDNRQRRMIVGINPGRFGAGLTGVPFTDPRRLAERCGITDYQGPSTHELSSVFVYEMISRYGGEDAFFGDFYMTSLCPLGFTMQKAGGREVNFNYYDSKPLYEAVRSFMVDSLRCQLDFGIRDDVGFCLGTGKNAAYLSSLNAEFGFFRKIVPLEHPRYVMQYKSREINRYIDKYLSLFALDQQPTA